MKILISSFKAFNGEELNPSEEVMKRICNSQLPKVFGQTLPVGYDSSFAELQNAIQSFNPDFILQLGQAAGRSRVSLEKVALNLYDSSLPDSDGNLRINQKIAELPAPQAFISDLPIREWTSALELMHPNLIEQSLTAGAYVCNSLYFKTQLTYPNIKSLFVHLPLSNEQLKVGDVRPAMSINNQVQIIQSLIELIIKNG
jgi:pyroglutamyl-peptidase